MLVFLSDLHLADATQHSTIDLQKLVSALREVVRRALEQESTSIRIVLLGDIFEILKSRVWLDRGLRPWQPSTSAHVDAIDAILEAIHSHNRPFFEGLTSLHQETSGLALHFVPGNHDAPLNTDMGRKARLRLRRVGT